MADSPATPPPETPPPATPPPNAPSSTSSPTFAVRPTASTQARWPGQRRRGITTLVGGGSSVGAGAVLLVLGPLTQLPGFFVGGLLGLLIGVVGLVIGLVRYLKGGYAVPAVKSWQAAALGGGFPIFIALVLEGFALSA